MADYAEAWLAKRTDLGRDAAGTKLAPNPRDALYFETDATLPVDFHSFRRAFSTALAEAGVNVQHAMNLASHSDPRVHARYVMRTVAMRTVPPEALPALPEVQLAAAAVDVSSVRSADRRDDSGVDRPSGAAGIVFVRDDSTTAGLPSSRAESRKLSALQDSRGSGCWTRP